MSSNDLKHVKHKGLPPSLYDVVQEMGRVDRLLQVSNGTNTYKVHLSLYSDVSLFIRIMKGSGSNARERKRLLLDMQEVLMMLVTPTTCHHSFIEDLPPG